MWKHGGWNNALSGWTEEPHGLIHGGNTELEYHLRELCAPTLIAALFIVA